MDDKNNEIHHVQFSDGSDDIPSSITILIRHSKHQNQPISRDDLLDIHADLKHYKGSITPYLK